MNHPQFITLRRFSCFLALYIEYCTETPLLIVLSQDEERRIKSRADIDLRKSVVRSKEAATLHAEVAERARLEALDMENSEARVSAAS